MPNFMGARERASDSQKKQNMASIKNALRTYYNDNQKYPDSATWSSDIRSYIPSIVDYSPYTYTLINSDSFRLGAEMEATKGEELRESQAKCGVTDNADKKYYVCAS